jgi:hypothetical protein
MLIGYFKEGVLRPNHAFCREFKPLYLGEANQSSLGASRTTSRSRIIITYRLYPIGEPV